MSIAGAHVISIVGLLETGGLPFAFGLLLFESVGDGYLRFGRWLLATSPGAKELFNNAFEKWARQLVGAPPWRSGAIASFECGWQLDGFSRAIVDVALRRARLWLLPREDFYAALFRTCSESNCGPSWARASLEILPDGGVPDLPD